MPMPIQSPHCPACAGVMRDKPSDNVSSTFAADVFICARCGTREAAQGFFWEQQWQSVPNAIRKTQTAWRKFHGE